MYLTREYSRTMTSLTTRKLLHVPDAPLAERLLFAALSAYRVVRNHEVFDVDTKTLEQAFDSVATCFSTLAGTNPEMQLQDVEALTVEEWYRVKHAGQQAACAAKVLARKRERDAIASEKAEQKRRKTEEPAVRRQRLLELLDEFIQRRCVTCFDLEIEIKTFKKLFEHHAQEILSSVALISFMKDKGYLKFQKRKDDGDRSYFFSGINCPLAV